jgi:hypothetical protein
VTLARRASLIATDARVSSHRARRTRLRVSVISHRNAAAASNRTVAATTTR